MKDNMVILLDEKKDPVVLAKENTQEEWKYYRVSQCIRKL